MSSTFLRTVAGVAAVITVFWLGKIVLGAGIVDDTYIFLRYAENLVRGHGLVFNHGERVEGYTSFLWVLLLSLLTRLGFTMPTAAVALSGLLGAALILTFAHFATTYLGSERKLLIWIVALGLAANPVLVYWAWSGMDTALFTLLFGLGVFVFVGEVKRPGAMFLSGSCILAAALTRLDALVVLPVYAVAIVLFNRGDPQGTKRKALSFAAPLGLLAIHFLWRYGYYDSLLPNTFYAKVGVPRWTLVQHGFGYAVHFVLALNLYWGALLVAALGKKQASRPEIAVPASVILTWTTYVVLVGGDHFAMFRFFVPILAPMAMLLLLAASHFLPARAPGPGWRRIAVLAVITVLLFSLDISVYRFHGGLRARYEVRLAQAWAKVGIWLESNVPSGSTIACVPVGAIPYFSGLETYDLLGLTDRTIAREGQIHVSGAVGHQKYDTDYILARRPDYIVYTDSGVTETPRSAMSDSLDTSYSYALYDLVRDKRTQDLYEFVSVEMPDRTYVELLRRKPLAKH